MEKCRNLESSKLALYCTRTKTGDVSPDASPAQRLTIKCFTLHIDHPAECRGTHFTLFSHSFDSVFGAYIHRVMLDFVLLHRVIPKQFELARMSIVTHDAT